ncbi:hypothetical protein [Mycolicibacterium sp. P1-5]|uniref:hypothetical protein n=1 Tax=Mycolicibacterium sp. P1-5 TaxID=2024617 RepID=UPI0011EC5D5A|nr:hypothetical protein [Mycolicibacterium sp. P1-5]
MPDLVERCGVVTVLLLIAGRADAADGARTGLDTAFWMALKVPTTTPIGIPTSAPMTAAIGTIGRSAGPIKGICETRLPARSPPNMNPAKIPAPIHAVIA